MRWTALPLFKGMEVAALWGDPSVGPYGAFVKLPANTNHTLHTHARDRKVVVMSGLFLYGPEGGPEKTFGGGSYLMIPAGLKHTTGCAAGAPCILFQEQAGKLDNKAAVPTIVPKNK